MVCLVAWEAIEVIFHPLPHIAKDIMETLLIGWIHVDRLRRIEKLRR